MYMLLSTPTICASSGWATVLSTTAAEAPANWVEMVTWGGTMSGNCATGMRSIESAPASVIRMAMTIARRGRSTKTAEIIRLLSRLRCRRRGRSGAGRHLNSGAHALDAVNDDCLALAQAAQDRGRRRCGLAKLDAGLRRLVLRVHGVDVIALLVGQDRGTGDGEDFDRLDAFDQNGDKFAVGEFAYRGAIHFANSQRGIGDRAAQDDRVGGGGHRVVLEGQLAGLAVDLAVRQPQPDHDGIEAALVCVAVAQVECRAQCDRK